MIDAAEELEDSAGEVEKGSGFCLQHSQNDKAKEDVSGVKEAADGKIKSAGGIH